jgi:HlyD family secretion protein
MKRANVILWTVLGIAGAAGLYVVETGSGAAVQYRFDTVTKGDITMSVTATGTLQAVTTVTVGAQVSGIIKKINVDFNDHVKKGQVIALIDPTTLQEAVREADAVRLKAHAVYEQSKRNFDRLTLLLKDNLVSQAEYDSASAETESNRAATASAEAEYKSAVINLNYATIRAPIDGVVISRNVDVGQTVASSFSAPTLFTIANDLTKMQVLASVDEADIGKIRKGQDVSFTVDAFADQTFSGTVSQVRLDAVIAANVVNYIVVINVPNTEKKLMPGMTATVTMVVQKKEHVLKVPSIALKFQPPAETVAAGGTAQTDTAHRQPGAVQGSGSPGAGIDQAEARRMLQNGLVRVWTVNRHNTLEPIVVHFGISDGTFTEIASDKIAEGVQIVSGIVHKK